jgi:hypothetical protein
MKGRLSPADYFDRAGSGERLEQRRRGCPCCLPGHGGFIARKACMSRDGSRQLPFTMKGTRCTYRRLAGSVPQPHFVCLDIKKEFLLKKFV